MASAIGIAVHLSYRGHFFKDWPLSKKHIHAVCASIVLLIWAFIELRSTWRDEHPLDNGHTQPIDYRTRITSDVAVRVSFPRNAVPESPLFINVYFDNKADHVLDGYSEFDIKAYPSLPADDDKRLDQEDEVWRLYLKDSKISTMSEHGPIVPGTSFTTIQTKPFPKVLADGFNNATGMVVYVVGVVKYKDENGTEHMSEYCQYAQHAQSAVLLCHQHNGPVLPR